MAASGGLKHIFEHTIPEAPTLFGTSSWKQIKPSSQIQPIEQSSITEIFGELHFKENSKLPSPSFPISPFSSAILNLSSREDEDIILSSSSPTVLRKKNFSSNSEGLQVCTEGLGSESCDNAWDNDTTNDMKQEWQSCKEKIDEASGIVNGKRGNMHGELKAVKQDGRFVLKQVRTPTQELLHACREDGRLKLQFMQTDDESMKHQGFDEEGHLMNDEIDDAVYYKGGVHRRRLYSGGDYGRLVEDASGRCLIRRVSEITETKLGYQLPLEKHSFIPATEDTLKTYYQKISYERT
ncbi:hypothetical protein F3Y22_tig00110418pilonHSYRG00308 [Hibiscus syriacus]|uniref:FAF domain-containing protein n=1 Tax=Hibiscus syriacus TaxID=106335 RepID=A0A6A3ANN8_HIBSY|nr:hypothetical protein F3Y22_tig00110418pilonHSYRG00308 [Hibiscus syriacus]